MKNAMKAALLATLTLGALTSAAIAGPDYKSRQMGCIWKTQRDIIVATGKLDRQISANRSIEKCLSAILETRSFFGDDAAIAVSRAALELGEREFASKGAAALAVFDDSSYHWILNNDP